MVKREFQKGGSLIGTGSFGCVYYPALACRHQKQYSAKFANSVMKLANKPGLNEVEISASLRHIDPTGHYFLPLQCETCEIDQTDPLVKECSLYQKMDNDERDNFKGYFSTYGGPSLHELLKDKRPITLDMIWRWISYLIESLNVLNSAQITHNDVTLKNIVIGADQLPRLIDFGISYYHDDMIETEYYKLHPLFISAFNTKNINDLYADYGHLPGFYNPDYVKGSANDIILSYFTRAKTSRQRYMKEVIEPNHEKVDLFMLFDLVTDYLNPMNFRKDDGDLTAMMIKLINNNLNPYVTKQFTLAQNLAEVKKINDFIINRKIKRDTQIQEIMASQSRSEKSQTPKPKSQMIKLLPAGRRTPNI